jgi:hypothetical protein
MFGSPTLGYSSADVMQNEKKSCMQLLLVIARSRVNSDGFVGYVTPWKTW